MPSQTIVSSRGKLVLMGLGCLAFSALGVWMIRSGEPRPELIGWCAVLLFGVLGIPAMLIQCLRPSTLELGDDAVVMSTALGRRFVIRWLDIQRFEVFSIRSSKQAGYTYKPGRRPDTVLQNMASGLGLDGGFANSWPMKPEALAALLERYRLTAEARAQG